MFRRLFLACGVLLSLSSVASAIPFIGLDDPCSGSVAAVALSPGTPLQLSNGGGVNCFYNPLSTFITDISFQTTIDTGLSADPVQCGVLNGNFFKSCSTTYNSGSGLLTIRFYDVNPSDSDNLNPNSTDPETGPNEQEGIPTLLPGCTDNQGYSSLPGEYACQSKGTFLVTLNDGGLEGSTDTGSWGTVGLQNVPNAFVTTQVNNMMLPEPSTLVLFGMGLLALAGRSRIRARQK